MATKDAFDNPTVKLSSEGFKLLVGGMAVHYFSPNSYGVATPLILDSVPSMIGHGIFSAMLALFALDQCSGPRFRAECTRPRARGSGRRPPSNGNKPTTRIGHRPSSLLLSGRWEKRPPSCGLLTLIPTFKYLPLPHMVSVLAYACTPRCPSNVRSGPLVTLLTSPYAFRIGGRADYMGGEDGRRFPFGLVVGASFAMASYLGGLGAAILGNFLFGVASIGYYFHALNRAKRNGLYTPPAAPPKDASDAEKDNKPGRLSARSPREGRQRRSREWW